MHLNAAHRMRKAEFRRVQGLPGEGLEAGLSGRGKPRYFGLEPGRIDGVAQHGMAQICHMDADLMSSPRLQPA